MCWRLKHLTFVALTVGVAESAALGFDAAALLVTLGRNGSAPAQQHAQARQGAVGDRDEPCRSACGIRIIRDFVTFAVAWTRSTYCRRRDEFSRQVEDSLHRCRRVFPVGAAVVAGEYPRVLLLGAGSERGLLPVLSPRAY
jgi:hypothetical protein